MKKVPKKLTSRLQSNPAELLEVTQHYYQSQLNEQLVAAFPVLRRQSVETLLFKILIASVGVGLLTLLAVLINPEIAWMAVVGAIIAFTMMSPNKTLFGIVAVTETELILVELGHKASLEPGKVTERIPRPATLPVPRPYRHRRSSGVLADALPFAEEGNKGWRYAFLTDRDDYLELIEELSNGRDHGSLPKSLALTFLDLGESCR